MNRLQKYLDKKKISGAQFAGLIGCSRMSVCRYLSGKSIPNNEIMQKIFSVTGGFVTANDFYGTTKGDRG